MSDDAPAKGEGQLHSQDAPSADVPMGRRSALLISTLACVAVVALIVIVFRITAKPRLNACTVIPAADLQAATGTTDVVANEGVTRPIFICRYDKGTGAFVSIGLDTLGGDLIRDIDHPWETQESVPHAEVARLSIIPIGGVGEATLRMAQGPKGVTINYAVEQPGAASPEEQRRVLLVVGALVAERWLQ